MVQTRYLRWKTFYSQFVSFSTCFTSHLFVICMNHGIKIKIPFRNWLILFKRYKELEHNAGFLLSRGGSAGLNVQMRARPAWRGSLGVGYEVARHAIQVLF